MYSLQTYTFPRVQPPCWVSPVPPLNVLGANIISQANGQSPTELINHIIVIFPAQRSKAARAHNLLLSCVFIGLGRRMDPRAKEQLQLTLRETSKVNLLVWSYQPRKAGELVVSIANPSYPFSCATAK